MFQESPKWISREDLERHARPGILVLAWRQARQLLRLYVIRPVHALRISFRSLCGHMSLLLAKKEWLVCLGSAYERRGVDEYLIPSKRVLARKDGIEGLFAQYPWASSIHGEMFLKGFDLGERYAQELMSIQNRTAED